MKNRIFKIKSITKKSIFTVIIISLSLLLITEPIFKSVMAEAIRPLFNNHIIALVNMDSHTMSSFLAKSNTYLKSLFRDEKFVGDLEEYCEKDPIKIDQSNDIINSLHYYYKAFENANGKLVECTSYPLIVSQSGNAFYSSEISACANTFLESEWFNDYRNDPEREPMTYSPILTVDEEDGETSYFAYVYSFDNDGYTYYSAMFTDFETVKELIGGSLGLGIEDYMLICKEEPIYQNEVENSFINIDSFKISLMSDTQYYVINRTDEISLDCSVLISYANEGLRLVMHITRDDMINSQKEIFTAFQVIIIIFAFIFSFAIMIMLDKVFRRLTVLSKKMSSVQSNNYNVEICDESDDEIGKLSETFNMMTSRIREDISRREKQEKREREMQYNLMVSAINPHFIYNTLNTITKLAEFGRTKDVIEVNNALIENLKDRLKSKSNSAFDSVTNEKNVLEQYMKIQSYLCDNKLDFNFYITDDKPELIIPKNILQPLVENSILHGILLNYDEHGRPKDGRIDVTVKKYDGLIHMQVADNGIGMTEELIDRYFSSKKTIDADSSNFEHIGIKNIKTRLSYLYDDNFEIKVASEPGHGTSITILVPVS